MKMIKCQVIKPVAGYGYHTNDEGFFPQEIVEGLEKKGFLKTIIEEAISTKEAKALEKAKAKEEAEKAAAEAMLTKEPKSLEEGFKKALAKKESAKAKPKEEAEKAE